MLKIIGLEQMLKYPDLEFNPKGMGENCDSGNCWKPGKENHDSNQTAMDRRFEVKLPKYTRQLN